MKKIKMCVSIFLLQVFFGLEFLLAQNHQSGPIETIVFGSCNKHDLPQPLWIPILEDNPDVFIWLGDNIYGDTHDMALLKSKYDAQNKNPSYLKLKTKSKIIGIWDDHDFGINDGGKYYTKKDESMQIMLDFLDEPKDSPRRKQQGVYAAYEYGLGENSVKVFLLDARFNRDTLNKMDQKYVPNMTGSILGEDQWKWLEEELKSSQAAVNLIASGIQFIPTEHPYEKWENFPLERERLFNLIASTKVNNPVLLSGDRHIAEISLLKNAMFPNGLYEITSSGLTHTWKDYKEEYNPYRQGKLIASLHYGLASFDWDNKKILFSIKGQEGQEYLQQIIPIF